MTPLIRLQDVRVVRGGRTIVSVDALDIAAGEILGIVGPNGSGKSTLLRVLALVLRPDEGAVYVSGRRVGDAQQPDRSALLEARRRITMVFQSPVLLLRSVFDNVAAGLRFRGVAETDTRRRTAFWLDRLGIAGLAGRRPGGLSGGELQRVALARALVLEPDLLLLDEPTANLDWPTRTRLLGDLRAILGEIKASAVLVTHDIHEVPHFADRLLVMRAGRVVQEGSPAAVMEGPADVETAVFLGYDNVLPAAAVGAGAGAGRDTASQQRMAFCIGPDLVLATAAADERAPSKAPHGVARGAPYDAAHGAADSAGAVAADGRISFSGRVLKIVPWGPLYRVSIAHGAAREGVLAGTCRAQDLIDGSIAEGKPVSLAFRVTDGVIVPAPDQQPA